jgi:Nucleotidyl transferase of unknown function (DUF2204)
MPRRASAFDAFCRDAFAFLSRRRIDYLVIGGLAVIALGEPRTTGDVDVVVFVNDDGARALLDAALAEGFEADRDAELRALEETGTLRVRRGPHQLDMIVASLPFETEALGRRQRARMFGRVVPLPTPEDLLVFKVLAGRAKDLVDAEGVARRHLAALDVRYVERAISAVADYAEDPGLLQRLADVLARARKA